MLHFQLLPNNEIGISFHYDPAIIEIIKTLSHRRWDSISKQWICPLSIAPEIQLVTKHKLPEHIYQQHNLIYSNQQIQYNPSLLKISPYPFQIEGIKFLSQTKNTLCADDVGLGKTLQAIATTLHLNCKKVLIICPASVKRQWQGEISKFTSHQSQLIEGTQPQRKEQYSSISPTFFIINYELLLHDLPLINLRQWDMVIADEITRIKNYRSKTLLSLSQVKTNFKLGLSATPLENSLKELHSIFSWINPHILGRWYDFVNQYTYYRKTPWNSYEITGIKNKELLHLNLKKAMIRRKKSDVFQQLPSITRQEYYVPLSSQQRLLYEQIRNKVITLIDKPNFNHNDQINTLTELLYLRECCSSPRLLNQDLKENGKIPEIIAILEQLNKSKIILFTQWKKFGDLLVEEIQKKWKCIFIHGDILPENRDKLISEFKESSDINILVTTDCLMYGMNLQFCDTIIHCDLLFNPQKMMQREGRVHRIGQEKPVTIITVMTQDTIEEKVYNLLQEKQTLFDEVIEGQVIDRELIKKIMR